MSSDMLNIAATGVRAARAALDVSSQNIANAATEGYVRRSIRLADVAGAGISEWQNNLTLRGVRVEGIARNVDSFRQSEVRRTGGDAARAQTELNAYSNVETALEQSLLYPAISGFENSLQRLTADPVNPSLRTAVLESARTLTRTFGIAAQGLGAAAAALQAEAAAGTDQVNQLAQQLTRVNVQLVRSQPGTADQVSLLDQRDALLKNLSGLTDITATLAANQSVEVRIGGASGPQLVSAAIASPLALTSAADGTISFTLGTAAVTPAAGSLAGHAQGLVLARDTRVQLDTIANALISSANTAQTSGAALDGSAGQLLFSGTGAAGIALALTSGNGLATAPAGSPANSRDPANLTALRSALVSADVSGQTNMLLFNISSAAQGRQLTSDALDAIAGAAKLALDNQSGVNLDDEAVNLVRYQQAFQASSRAIQIASDLFDTLLAIR